MSDDVLVKGLNIAVIGALTPFFDKYPVLKSVLNKSKRPSNDWDFFMTVAGVGTYLLKNKVTKERHEEIINQLAELDIQMPEGLNNFNKFVENSTKANVDNTAIVGVWVLWNIAGEAPTHEESKALAPAIGYYLLNVVKDLER